MKALVQDIDALRALRPNDVAAYLRTHGWAFTGQSGAFARYEHGAHGQRTQVEVPQSDEYRDYHVRIAEVLDGLSRVEKRSQLDVLHDLSVASVDVVRLRLIGTALGDGSVPLDDGAMLVDRFREIMLASACAVVEQRPYFSTRKPTDAVEYVKKLRLGQTEQGSFVMTVLSPVTPLLTVTEAGDLFPAEMQAPFERRVTETLMTATAAATSAAGEAGATGNLAPFEQALSKGANANLCDGLASMLVDRPFSSLELSVGWSGNRPAPTTVLRSVRVTREAATFLASGAQQLKTRAPREGFELTGYVVALDNPNVRAQGGVVTIAAAVESDVRRVRVALTAADYQAAIGAHQNALRVTCAGRLSKSGRQYELVEPRSFAVVGED